MEYYGRFWLQQASDGHLLSVVNFGSTTALFDQPVRAFMCGLSYILSPRCAQFLTVKHGADAKFPVIQYSFPSEIKQNQNKEEQANRKGFKSRSCYLRGGGRRGATSCEETQSGICPHLRVRFIAVLVRANYERSICIPIPPRGGRLVAMRRINRQGTANTISYQLSFNSYYFI